MFQLVLVEHPSTCVRAWQSALLKGVNNSWTKEPTGMVPCGHFGMKWHAGEATELGDSHKHAIFFSSDHFHISKVNSGLADIPTSQYSWASSVPNHQVTSGVFQTVGVFACSKRVPTIFCCWLQVVDYAGPWSWNFAQVAMRLGSWFRTPSCQLPGAEKCTWKLRSISMRMGMGSTRTKLSVAIWRRPWMFENEGDWPQNFPASRKQESFVCKACRTMVCFWGNLLILPIFYIFNWGITL